MFTWAVVATIYLYICFNDQKLNKEFIYMCVCVLFHWDDDDDDDYIGVWILNKETSFWKVLQCVCMLYKYYVVFHVKNASFEGVSFTIETVSN